MHFIDITYEHPEYETEAPEAVVLERLEQILGELEEGPCEFSVSFVSDQSIQELNAQYRGKDEPTDILSFVQEDDVEDFAWPEIQFPAEDGLPEEVSVLGDIVISLDTLKRNAQSFSVKADEELFRLLIHGLLHLLGEDHGTNDMTEPMLIKQEAILSKLGGSQH